jgi:hypothetical protein
LPGLLAVIFADADDFEAIAAVNGLKLLQIRERRAAGSAPGGPEIQNRYFSL